MEQVHHYPMSRAYQEALKAADDGEVPVGAVICDENGAILGRGSNAMERLKDATAHAEILAIGAAAQKLDSWRLDGCTLYVTLEPCLMCLGALLNARIGTIVYGAPDPHLGAVDSHFYRQEIERCYRFFPRIIPGVMQHECRALLTSFFHTIRKKS